MTWAHVVLVLGCVAGCAIHREGTLEPGADASGSDGGVTRPDAPGMDAPEDVVRVDIGPVPDVPELPDGRPGPLHVSTMGTAGASGTVEDPILTIIEAADRAAAGQEVWVEEGTYVETLPMRDGSTLVGSWCAGFSRQDLDDCVTIVAPEESTGAKATDVDGVLIVGFRIEPAAAPAMMRGTSSYGIVAVRSSRSE